MLRKWSAGTGRGNCVSSSHVQAAEQRSELSPGRVREPWVHVTTNPAAAEQRQSSLAKKCSSYESNRLSCQTIISRAKNNHEVLCRCSAARIFVRQVTQGSQTRLGLSSDRCSAAFNPHIHDPSASRYHPCVRSLKSIMIKPILKTLRKVIWRSE